MTRDWFLTETPSSAWQARAGRWYRVWLRTARSPAMLFGLTILALIVLCALLAPWLAPFDPNAQDINRRMTIDAKCSEQIPAPVLIDRYTGRWSLRRREKFVHAGGCRWGAGALHIAIVEIKLPIGASACVQALLPVEAFHRLLQASLLRSGIVDQLEIVHGVLQ